MKPLILTSLICALAQLTPMLRAAEKAELESHASSYHAAGKAIVEMAITKKVDSTEVAKRVETLVSDAIWMAKEYAKAKPKGERLLKVILENVETMKKLSFKELEHEWHDLHHFDKADKDIGLDVKAEENEHFTDPIHSIVHPLLVLKAAESFVSSKSEGDLKSIKEEMEEGLEQMEKQKDTLLKK